jgi:hypothetical protein
VDLLALAVWQTALAAAPEVGHDQITVLVGRRGADLREGLARTHIEAFAGERLVQQAAQRKIVLEQQHSAAQHDAGPIVTETLLPKTGTWLAIKASDVDRTTDAVTSCVPAGS